MKFEEGLWYLFKIINVLIVPEKGEHYVILHDSGRKMLLKTHYYVKYNFSIGQIINCRIDKVNCTGQIYIEPKHPFYTEGSIYNFHLIAINRGDGKTVSITVKDILSNRIELLINKDFENKLSTSSVDLKVDKIKKGVPILSIPELNKTKVNITGQTIKLRVKEVLILNSEEYFTFSDGQETIARLKVKHYKNYGFKVQQEISCQLRGYESNGLLIIEPENPWYKIGESYYFNVKSIEEYLDLNGDMVKSAVVIDINGNKCGVILHKEYPQIEKSSVRCKVVGFRKGRPQLEIDPI